MDINKNYEKQNRQLSKKINKILCFNAKYPKIVKNEEVYNKTKLKPWSTTMEVRQFEWLGRILKLKEDTPAKLALEYAIEPTKKYRSCPKTTWPTQITEKLKLLHLSWADINEIANNQVRWKALTSSLY